MRPAAERAAGLPRHRRALGSGYPLQSCSSAVLRSVSPNKIDGTLLAVGKQVGLAKVARIGQTGSDWA